jgi:hypothetical protein
MFPALLAFYPTFIIQEARSAGRNVLDRREAPVHNGAKRLILYNARLRL